MDLRRRERNGKKETVRIDSERTRNNDSKSKLTTKISFSSLIIHEHSLTHSFFKQLA
jgi:hypothetical protein